VQPFPQLGRGERSYCPARCCLCLQKGEGGLLSLPATFSREAAVFSGYDDRINEVINHNNLMELMGEREPADETNRLF